MTDSESYFTLSTPPDVPVGEGRYVDLGGVSPIEFVPGLEFRPVLGDRLLVNFVRYEPHTEAPLHAHEEEQITFAVEGEFEFDLDGDVRTMRPGMVIVIPPHVPHGARTLDSTCYEIDIFSPPRRVLLEAMASGDGTQEPPGSEE
jgi:quercetin dioxygenase-like cupin family protein